MPSGYVDWEEVYLSAAVREARQETGLEVEVEGIINLVSSFVSPRFHFLGIYLAARVVGGELRAGDDLAAVAWFPVDALPELGFVEDREVIEALASGAAQALPGKWAALRS